MNYIIDGYNLIGKITSITFKDPEKENKCISFIEKFNTQKKQKFTIVFDGKGPQNTYPSYQYQGKTSVIFTDNEESADDFIIRKIEKAAHPSNYCVVSSDHAILLAAKKLKIKRLTSEEFLKQLLHREEREEEKVDMKETNIDYWLEKFND
ncbi:hypothetical protein DID78_00705 [Candidatus Marinamargulisbacteria bacterium SCGC AG-343-D04]|nr:hypothetical protein DID78_00705 [Candidatus Marinamargulisbacteria bacterium SCGC AG-343-D04]